MIADATRTTALFPSRTPEGSEVMLPSEWAAFRAWYETPAGCAFYDALAVHVAERIGVTTGRILSVGEGEGALASRLARLLPGAEVVGVDLCPRAVRAARKKHRAPNLRFVVGGATDLAGHGPAQAVVCVQAFHHFDEPARGLEAMIGALSPGGALLVIDLRRDADVPAYARRIDAYLAAGSYAKARLLRASVAAAHTIAELRSLARGLIAGARVRKLAFTAAARAAYARIDAGSLARVEADVAGLMVELSAVVAPERSRALGARGPRGRRAPQAGPDERALPCAPAGPAGVVLWNAEGVALWIDAGARALGARCGTGWTDLLAEDARALAARLEGPPVERGLPLEGGGQLRALTSTGPSARGLGAITTLVLEPSGAVSAAGHLHERAAHYGLTPRERDVVGLALEGLVSRQIAARLQIATPTVGTHLTRAYRKTGASGRVALACLFRGTFPADPSRG